MILTPGQRGDAPIAPDLPKGLSPQRILADKSYNYNALRSLIVRMQAESGRFQVLLDHSRTWKRSRS